MISMADQDKDASNTFWIFSCHESDGSSSDIARDYNYTLFSVLRSQGDLLNEMPRSLSVNGVIVRSSFRAVSRTSTWTDDFRMYLVAYWLYATKPGGQFIFPVSQTREHILNRLNSAHQSPQKITTSYFLHTYELNVFQWYM